MRFSFYRARLLALGCPLVLLAVSAADKGAYPLTNGSDLTGWKASKGPLEWYATDAVSVSADGTSLVATPGKGGIIINGKGKTAHLVTQAKFADVELHVEFLIPKGSNSGVYLQGLYEIQVSDSYGKPQVNDHDCGAVYQRWINGKGLGGTAPLTNASKPSGQWQSFDIKFQAPRFDTEGKKIANAKFIEVKHNGVVIHRNIEVQGNTRASLDIPEAPTNPLMLQGDHGPVAYRNIVIRSLSPQANPERAGLAVGDIKWTAKPPFLSAEDRDGDHYFSIKDPTIVRADGRWHLFASMRGAKRSHQIEYASFADWNDAPKAKRETMRLTDGYFCAPQVFYFRPHKKWYLLYQIVDKTRKPALQPAFSTTSNISDVSSWTKPQLLIDNPEVGVKGWIDFWTICDDSKCHLFFTSLDGRFWRSETAIGSFPKGWSRPVVAIQDDIYEASHTYRLKGSKKFFTVVEAQDHATGRRYFKSYVADRLDGEWRPLAAMYGKGFATPSNVSFAGEQWTQSFSHGELIRDGNDERLIVDESRPVLLIQGVRDEDRTGKKYGEIPWRLGLLEAAR